MKTPIEAGNWVLFMGNLFVVQDVFVQTVGLADSRDPETSMTYSEWVALSEDARNHVNFVKLSPVGEVQEHVKEILEHENNVVACASIKRINPISAQKRGFLVKK